MKARKLTRAELAAWEERLRAEGLGAGEFDWTIQKRRSFRADNDLTAAMDFLHEHDFSGDDFGRRCWELHADGVSNRAIARKLASNRKKVDRVVGRLALLMGGRLTRRGRARLDDARRRGGTLIGVRLNEAETGALWHAIDKLRARGELPRNGGHTIGYLGNKVLRAALLEFARRV